jgi:hypothetical protein
MSKYVSDPKNYAGKIQTNKLKKKNSLHILIKHRRVEIGKNKKNE